MENSASQNTDMPVVVGVTGHRDIPDKYIPELIKSIREFFMRLRTQYSVVTVLSSLAEGADQLCADIAIDEGCSLIVPLPLKKSKYRKDFSKEAKLEFDRLCALADDVFVVTPGEPTPHRPKNGFYYRQAGLYIAQHSQVLLALWDSSETETWDGAGTYATIKLALKAEGNTDVYQIVTPRKGSILQYNAFNAIHIKACN